MNKKRDICTRGTKNCISKTLQYFSKATHGQHSKHALADIEGVSPVVIWDHAIVLPHSQQPSAEGLNRSK